MDEIPVVNRAELLQSVARRVARDDSFFTLPFTVVQLLLFIGLVDKHLRIFQRQELESALEDWVIGSGKTLTGPFVAEHVADGSTFWDWLEVSALPAVYGGRADGPAGLPMVELASTSVLVGDAQLWQRRTDGSESAEWLLHTATSRADLSVSPGNFLGAAINASRHLRATGWLDDSVEVKLSFSTYNERASMFGVTEASVGLSNYGVVKPQVSSTAAVIESYPEVYVYVLDAVYMLLLLYKLSHEAYELLLSLQTGCDTFMDYWSIWNVIDWTDVMLGVMGCGFWIRCCLAMQAESLHALLGSDSPALQVDVMSLSVAQLTEVHSSIMNIRRGYIELHLVFAANMIAIMAKFFKAFEANPRLKVVTATLAESYKDIVHFLVVFITVFLSFAIIAHVLFGGDLVEFYTIATAVNTGFFVLMGEFAWYVEIQNYSRPTLPSGMPFVLVNVWFFMYMFFVLLVLLNMLLAIILAHYTAVTQANAGSLTLWQQSKEWTRWKLDTRSFIPLHKIWLLLERDDDPAHPEDEVSEQSLLSAFPGMQQRQASFLVQWLTQEKLRALGRGGDGEGGTISYSNETLVQDIQGSVRELTSSMESSALRLARLEALPPRKERRVNI